MEAGAALEGQAFLEVVRAGLNVPATATVLREDVP